MMNVIKKAKSSIRNAGAASNAFLGKAHLNPVTIQHQVPLEQYVAARIKQHIKDGEVTVQEAQLFSLELGYDGWVDVVNKRRKINAETKDLEVKKEQLEKEIEELKAGGKASQRIHATDEGIRTKPTLSLPTSLKGKFKRTFTPEAVSEYEKEEVRQEFLEVWHKQATPIGMDGMSIQEILLMRIPVDGRVYSCVDEDLHKVLVSNFAGRMRLAVLERGVVCVVNQKGKKKESNKNCLSRVANPPIPESTVAVTSVKEEEAPKEAVEEKEVAEKGASKAGDEFLLHWERIDTPLTKRIKVRSDYHDEVVSQDLKLSVGEVAKTTDSNKRKMIVVGTPKGNLMVFQRYTKGEGGVIVANGPDSVTSALGLNSALSADDLSSLFIGSKLSSLLDLMG